MLLTRSVLIVSLGLAISACTANGAFADAPAEDGASHDAVHDSHRAEEKHDAEHDAEHGSEHDAEHGSEHDAEHGDGHEAINPSPLTIDPDLAIFTAVVFLILLVVLKKFAWKPIIEGLNQREQGIASSVERAKQSAEKAEEVLRQYQAKLVAAMDRVREIVAAARSEAEVEKEKIVSQAQQAAHLQRDNALAEIESAKALALRTIAETHIALALHLAGKIVRKKISAEVHARSIQKSRERFIHES